MSWGRAGWGSGLQRDRLPAAEQSNGAIAYRILGWPAGVTARLPPERLVALRRALLALIALPSLAAATALVALSSQTSLCLLVLSVALSVGAITVVWTCLEWILSAGRRGRPDGASSVTERNASRPRRGVLHRRFCAWETELGCRRPGQPPWAHLVPAGLVVASASALAWLAWRKPGPWEAGLVVAVIVVLTGREGRWPEKRPIAATVAVARGRLAATGRGRRQVGALVVWWRELPAVGRATILMLGFLSLVIAFAFAGFWVFVSMAAVDFAALNCVIPASVGGHPEPSRSPRPPGPAPALMADPGLTNGGGWATVTQGADVVFTSRRLVHNSSAPVGAEIGDGHPPAGQLTMATAPGALAPGPTRDGHAVGLVATDVPGRPLPVPADSDSSEPAVAPQDQGPQRRRRSRSDLATKLQPRVAMAAGILAVGWIAYAHPGPILLIAVLVLGVVVPFTSEIDRDEAMTMVVAIGVGVASVDYLSWRIVVTNWDGWWIAAPLLWAEILGAMHVLGFQVTVWPWPQPKLEPVNDASRHPIFIFVPTVDEGPEILRPTLEGAITARCRYQALHPHADVTIVVCNDGRVANAPAWPEVDALAQELGVCCVTRDKGGGAKAGNLENARQRMGATGDALVIIFDADQVPTPEFLVKTISPFADPSVGWVQTGQYYGNLDNPVSRWADDQQSLFYNLLCPGKACLNSAFICGTNVVIRASALDEIGGLPQNSVTEDFAASVALHPRWRSLYVRDVLAIGLGPLDVPSYLKQQRRWALGTLGVLRSNWRDIFLPRRHGLRLPQRLQYLLACTHYLCGLRDLIYMVSPVLFIVTGIPAVRSATLGQYLWHFVPYGLLGLLGIWYAGHGVTGLRGVIIGFGSFPALIGSLIMVTAGRRVGFAVTSKAQRGTRSRRHVWMYCACVGLCLVGLIWATQARGEQRTSLFISVLWVVYSLTMLGLFLWLVFRDIKFHSAAEQAKAPQRVIAKQPYPDKLGTRGSALRPARNAALALLSAAPLLIGNQLSALPVFESHAPSPFRISQQLLAAPYLGLSVPVQLLRGWPETVQRKLGERLSIIGRTQDIHDRFDTAWAQRLAARGAHPWITIEFGVFGPHHRVPIGATLPAIFNGADDADITRWAAEIRAFGRPVYLTILRHTDRNWSMSSAVANGGIPEDVPRAWRHVQTIFKAVGATNVAWVWAPADPVSDQQFAPPPQTITMVLQSFINYPGAQWGDPNRILSELARRYPGKPLFVEASAAGPAAEKVRWLTELAAALRACHQLYAFLYHEGGPALKPTQADITSWSAISDPASLAETRRIMSELVAERGAR